MSRLRGPCLSQRLAPASDQQGSKERLLHASGAKDGKACALLKHEPFGPWLANVIEAEGEHVALDLVIAQDLLVALQREVDCRRVLVRIDGKCPHVGGLAVVLPGKLLALEEE